LSVIAELAELAISAAAAIPRPSLCVRATAYLLGGEVLDDVATIRRQRVGAVGEVDVLVCRFEEACMERWCACSSVKACVARERVCVCVGVIEEAAAAAAAYMRT